MRRSMRRWYRAVTVEGLNLGRFVRQAGEAGIHLKAMRRRSAMCISALVLESELPRLQEVAYAGGWKLTAGRLHGMGRGVQWMCRRWLAVSALCATLAALVICSQVVWTVEVEGGGVYQADILGAVHELGIQPPLFRRQVDLGALRDALEWRYPRLAWVECGWRGTALVIRPAEGALPDAAQAEHAMDVVAARDGVIIQVVTVAGTPAVQPGDIVRAGEVLIRGEERTYEGAVKPVAARGSVTARVWRSAEVRMSAVERVTHYTGAEQTVSTLRAPWFDLWGTEDCGFAAYDTAVSETTLCGIFIPVRLRTERRMEAEITCSPRERAPLEAEAYAAAVHQLKEKVAAEESLIDFWGNCSMIDAETILSVAVGELLTEIGMRVPASGMAAPAGEAPE